ncbi:MAG: DUF3347 domain-containing protein [Bacteroidota bacterium]
MKTILSIIIIGMLSITACNASIKNASTQNVKVYGNCDICKANIEKAGSSSDSYKTIWNKDSKIAAITFDKEKTNLQAVLKQIALAGYDNEQYLAPTESYNKLLACCQYDRAKKQNASLPIANNNTSNTVPNETAVVTNTNQLTAVFDHYFLLKDALVQSNNKDASNKALNLEKSLQAIKMEQLTSKEHVVWMKIEKDLKSITQNIAKANTIEKQRNYFIALSKNMYDLLKVSSTEQTIYYQHCPMANNGKGANWLSKENTIKNPYYGSQMLSCGSTIETIKP